MLIRYMFDNFCSFKEECEFSLEAPGGKVKKRFPDNYTTTETGYDLLKTAVIVGENAGGKSNFIIFMSMKILLIQKESIAKNLSEAASGNQLSM